MSSIGKETPLYWTAQGEDSPLRINYFGND
jgi:hypothetical protein